MEKKYYLSIDSNNLGRYFSTAIVAPQKYYKEITDDLQSLNKEFLIFTSNKFTDKSDCCIEVILTEKEVNKLINNPAGTCALLNAALPITRVASVFFYSREKMENTIDLAKSSANIPERLIKQADKNDFFGEDINDFVKNNEFEDLTSQLNLFDRYIGGFAFMKISGENYLNYSQNYFSTLSFFNKAIENQINSIINSLKLSLDKRLQGIFNENENDNSWLKWRNLVFGSHKELEKELNEKVRVKSGLYQQNEVVDKRDLYILSVLANYGPDQIKLRDVDNLLLGIISNEIKYKETVALFFGIHTGYRKLKKSYIVKGENIPIKFTLTSKLDYYTIESIYQFAFNNIISNNFSFIEELIKENTKEKPDLTKYKTYQIIDEHIIYEQKPTSVNEIIKKFFKIRIIPNLLNSLILDFSKKNDLELNEFQKNIIGAKFESLIEKPIYELLHELENDIKDFAEQEKIGYITKNDEASKRMSTETLSIPIQQELKIHEYYLNVLSPNEITKIAKKKKIIDSKYKITKENQKELISKIIEYIEMERKMHE